MGQLPTSDRSKDQRRASPPHLRRGTKRAHGVYGGPMCPHKPPHTRPVLGGSLGTGRFFQVNGGEKKAASVAAFLCLYSSLRHFGEGYFRALRSGAVRLGAGH